MVIFNSYVKLPEGKIYDQSILVHSFWAMATCCQLKIHNHSPGESHRPQIQHVHFGEGSFMVKQ